MKLEVIEAFLREKGYDFSSDWHGHFASFENDEVSISWNGNYTEVLQDCLDHWLILELGRNWQWVYQPIALARDVIGGGYGFSDIEMQDIEKAIAYHKELESEAE